MNTVETMTVSDDVLAEYDAGAEDLIQFAAEALKRPSESGWHDEDLWHTHTLMFSTPAWWLTEDYVLGQANYRAVLKDLTEEFPDDVTEATFGHWTYSTYQTIKVRVVDENGAITKAFAKAESIERSLAEQYPVYDEELLSQMESELLDEYLDDVIQDVERDKSNELEQDWVASDKWKDAFRQFIYEQASSIDGVWQEDIKKATAYADDEKNHV